ncbi:MAG: HAMP domain-containing protein [Acidobacteriota bacterium]
MYEASSLAKELKHFLWKALSVPIYFKILGIGAVVAALFGGAIILHAKSSMSRVLYQMLEEHTLSAARSLVADLERPMVTGDLFSVKRNLQRTLGMIPQMRYIIVRDEEGRVVAHTFEKGVPPDLGHVFSASPWGTTEVLATPGELVFDTVAPILKGHGGSVQLGMSDRLITEELAGLTRSVIGSLALCVAVGSVLALGLTHLLTQPLHHLVQVTDRIRRGDFEAKARVFSADEIGRLAASFNQMAESLESYRQEVVDKEKARFSLIEKIIQTQEEERKRVSRELHDELGQSLLALLLMIQSGNEGQEMAPNLIDEAEKKIGQLIDEVRRLAHGMRPPILDDYGLDFALARLVEEVSNYYGLAIDYQYICQSGLGRLPNRVEVSLYRIAQEAIANIVRHAHAEQASVVVLQRRKDAVLLVEDDGCGFDPKLIHSKDGNHLGLTGMQERAALLGGSCAVESVPGNGTAVKVKIPATEAR